MMLRFTSHVVLSASGLLSTPWIYLLWPPRKVAACSQPPITCTKQPAFFPFFYLVEHEVALYIGVLTYSFSTVDLSLIMSCYTSFALLGSILPQIASAVHMPWLNYIASFLSGFFISVPYASLDLVLMDLCTTVKISRVLSLTSLLSQIAAAVAGYPVYQFLTHVCHFKYTPIVLTCLLGCACICLWTIFAIKSSTKKEKSD